MDLTFNQLLVILAVGAGLALFFGVADKNQRAEWAKKVLPVLWRYIQKALSRPPRKP